MNRIVFAGSVVRPDYPWQPLLSASGPNAKPQVGRVLNYVASREYVVASVPTALQAVTSVELGAAGHCGFLQQPGVVRIEFVPGAHSAALQDRHWDEIAAFVVAGRDPDRNPVLVEGALGRRISYQAKSVALLASCARWGVPIATGLLLLIAALLWMLLPGSLLVFSLGLLTVTWFLRRVLTQL